MLNHEFLVLNKSELQAHKLSYQLALTHKADIKILHDDLIQYLSDSLKWLNTNNDYGLNYYGNTVLEKEATLQLRKVLQAWHDLFSLANDPLILRGLWTTTCEVGGSGYYETLTLDKTQVLDDLVAVICLCRQVEDADDTVLIHFGI